jgi:hypothetical protein
MLNASQVVEKDVMRLSGLQRDVLSLYRRCLREVRNKPVVWCRLERGLIALKD